MTKEIKLDKDELLLKFKTNLIWLTQEQERGGDKENINRLAKISAEAEVEIYNRMR